MLKKVKNKHVLNRRTDFISDDYRVATLSKLYPTVIGIILHSYKSMGYMYKLTKRAKRNGQTNVGTDPNYRNASLLLSTESR